MGVSVSCAIPNGQCQQIPPAASQRCRRPVAMLPQLSSSKLPPTQFGHPLPSTNSTTNSIQPLPQAPSSPRASQLRRILRCRQQHQAGSVHQLTRVLAASEGTAVASLPLQHTKRVKSNAAASVLAQTPDLGGIQQLCNCSVQVSKQEAGFPCQTATTISRFRYGTAEGSDCKPGLRE